MQALQLIIILSYLRLKSECNNVINMDSFDRHFLGLKLCAAENGLELPGLYSDAAFKRLCHYYISSSQVSSRHEAVSCFGPVVEDGYGACYNIMEKKLLFGLTSFKSAAAAGQQQAGETSARRFGEAIRNALLDMQRLLVKLSTTAKL